MKICYFGIYPPNYTRNRVNIDGLRENGVGVLECNVRTEGFKKYWQLFRKHKEFKGKYDVMIVGFNGHTVVPLAWMLTRFPRKKLIFDAFISTYDSNIFDRQKHSRYSIKAVKYWLIDWLSCVLSDMVLMDAEAHCDYMAKTFHISRDKFNGLLVGCSSEVMHPRSQNKTGGDFIVHFHGTYIPTQGIPYIIEAAKLLENKGIKFNIVGKLNTYGESLELAKKLNVRNVNFFDYMPYEKLAELIAEADVCLGAFGNTEKAKRTYIFKIVEAMAMKKPVITGVSPALLEFLSDRKNVLFCNLADSEDLADKILELKNDPILSRNIAEGGFELYQRKLTPKAIGRELLNLISQP